MSIPLRVPPASDLRRVPARQSPWWLRRYGEPTCLQRCVVPASPVDADMLNEGVFFDGSSIAGWKAINESDMILKPDTARMFMDPFTSHNTVVLFCLQLRKY